MTEDGIHYRILVECASLNERIRLCPADMRTMLEEAVRCSYPEQKMHTLVDGCIDFPTAVRDTESANMLLSLIRRYCEADGTDMQERITSYVPGVPIGMSNGALLEFLVKNPRMLLHFLKYPTKETVEAEEEISSEKISPAHELRYYQLTAARDIAKQLESSPHCVMYHAPTGSGKTRTAMSVVTRHLRTYGPTVVLWLASSTELVNQAAKAFKTAWTHHGDIPCMLRLWRGDSPHFEPDYEPERNSMLITGLQKVSLACGTEPSIPKKLQKIVSLIVFDEAHQSIAPTYRRLIDGVMEGGRCHLLGLSATPGRSNVQNTEELAAIYHGQKVSIWSPPELNPIEYLVQEGYLAKVRFHKIDLESGPPLTSPSNEDYPHKELDKIGLNMERNTRIVNTVKQVIEGGHSRILVFSPSVSSAQMCAAMLKAWHDINKSDVLKADTKKEVRSAILNKYSNKTDRDAHVIFNYGILTTGFDAPGTSVAVIARPTASVSLYSQMVGRAIRGIKSGGNKTADIYTVVDTSFPQFGNVALAFDNWNAQWAGKSDD